jgi:hypothetical protein
MSEDEINKILDEEFNDDEKINELFDQASEEASQMYANYDSDPLEKIRQAEIKRIQFLFDELKQSGKLCSSTGKDILVEFGFKGNLNQVLEQMLIVIALYKNNAFIEADRTRLNDNLTKLAIYHQNQKDEFYKVKWREQYLKGDIANGMKFLDAMTNRDETLHNKKECECYVN